MADRHGYQIQIEGWIGERWTHWFDEAAVHSGQADDGAPITTLSGAFDQAALRGLLAKIWDLNLTVLSVTCTKEEPSFATENTENTESTEEGS